MKDFYQLQEEYFEYLKILNRAKRTIGTIHWSLDKFFRFLKDYSIQDIEDIRAEHIHEYQKYRHYFENRFKRKDSVTAQNHHLSTVKGLFQYLKKMDYILQDPTASIKYAKEPQTLPKSALTNTEMKSILRKPDTQTPLGYRDRTILELLYSTGIRKSELMNLKVEDVDYEEGYLRINQGKGGKDRVTPIGKIASHYLETYIKGIRPFFLKGASQDRLFLSKRNRPLSKNMFDHLIGKCVKKTKIEKHVTTHTFRRSCATEMIKNKANLMHVKELLGHKNLETVQRYCSLSITDLKEAHQKHHPREKDEK